MNSRRMVILLICLLCLSSAQYKWESIFGGSGRDQAFSVALTPEGGYIAAGLTASFPQKCYEMYVVKTDMYGDSVWIRHFGTANNDYCWSIVPAQDSGYVLIGATDSVFQTGPHDVYLLKISDKGDSLWSRVYGDTSDATYTNDVGHTIEQTADGGYIIVGSTESYGAGLHDIYLIKISAPGDTQWTRTYGTSYNETGESVCQTSDGGYIIAGTTYVTGSGQQIWIVRTDENGDTMWTQLYGGSGSEDVSDIMQCSDNGYILVGSTTSYGAGSGDLYLVRTDSLGTLNWTKTYGYQYPDWGNALAQTTDSGYIIIGGTRTSPDPEYCCAWLLKIDANGDTSWTQFKTSAIGAANGMDVLQAPDGGYIIAAITWDYQGEDDVLLMKTDSQGLPVFEKSSHDKEAAANRCPFVLPNPFVRFTSVSGHENEIYHVHNAAGQLVGSYPGSKVGSDLLSGVYFLLPQAGNHDPIRVVKVQ